MESLEILILKDVNISGCSKLERLPENMGNAESVEELDASGTAIRELLSFHGCKELLSFQSRSWYDLLTFSLRPKSPELSNLRSLTKLYLRNCYLKAIPDDIGCLPDSIQNLSNLCALNKLDLISNCYLKAIPDDIGCLPDSIDQPCKLEYKNWNNCTSLQSLLELPSLETIPDLLKPNSTCEVELYLSNCSKLADNQGVADMFFAVIIKHLQVSLSLSLKNLLCMFQGLFLKKRYIHDDYNRISKIIIPGSEIPKWFRHQSMGDEVNIEVPFSHLPDELTGIAVCVVFSSLLHHQISNSCYLSCKLIVNGEELYSEPSIETIVGLSDHIWLFYLPFPYYEEEEDDEEKYIELLKECKANEFNQIGIKIETNSSSIEVKKCGLHVVYKEDIEDLHRTMAHSSNTSIIPYEDLGVVHHNFVNSAVVAEAKKAKQMCDNYMGAGLVEKEALMIDYRSRKRRRISWSTKPKED